MGDCVATMYVTFYLRFISNNVDSLIWAGFTINIVTVIAALFLVESPAWLVSVGETQWMESSVKYVAKFNGITNFYVGTVVPNDQGGDLQQATPTVEDKE